MNLYFKKSDLGKPIEKLEDNTDEALYEQKLKRLGFPDIEVGFSPWLRIVKYVKENKGKLFL